MVGVCILRISIITLITETQKQSQLDHNAKEKQQIGSEIDILISIPQDFLTFPEDCRVLRDPHSIGHHMP